MGPFDKRYVIEGDQESSYQIRRGEPLSPGQALTYGGRAWEVRSDFHAPILKVFRRVNAEDLGTPHFSSGSSFVSQRGRQEEWRDPYAVSTYPTDARLPQQTSSSEYVLVRSQNSPPRYHPFQDDRRYLANPQDRRYFTNPEDKRYPNNPEDRYYSTTSEIRSQSVSSYHEYAPTGSPRLQRSTSFQEVENRNAKIEKVRKYFAIIDEQSDKGRKPSTFYYCRIINLLIELQSKKNLYFVFEEILEKEIKINDEISKMLLDFFTTKGGLKELDEVIDLMEKNKDLFDDKSFYCWIDKLVNIKRIDLAKKLFRSKLELVLGESQQELDLHGFSCGGAYIAFLINVENWNRFRRWNELHKMILITGKGHHSSKSKPFFVLRDYLLDQLNEQFSSKLKCEVIEGNEGRLSIEPIICLNLDIPG